MSGQRKTLGRILRRLQQGAALSEFIVVLPALLLVGLGTGDWGQVFHYHITLSPGREAPASLVRQEQ